MCAYAVCLVFGVNSVVLFIYFSGQDSFSICDGNSEKKIMPLQTKMRKDKDIFFDMAMDVCA